MLETTWRPRRHRHRAHTTHPSPQNAHEESDRRDTQEDTTSSMSNEDATTTTPFVATGPMPPRQIVGAEGTGLENKHEKLRGEKKGCFGRETDRSKRDAPPAPSGAFFQ